MPAARPRGSSLADGVAQLSGAAPAPAHRRRGLQSALLAARLADAAAAGCDVAVITTQPGSKSHQNAQRQGFDLLYAVPFWSGSPERRTSDEQPVRRVRSRLT